MKTHRFDPISAILGMVAVAIGLAVALGRTDRLDTTAGVWIAILALGIGVALLPWGARVLRSADRVAVHADPMVADLTVAEPAADNRPLDQIPPS